jgi:hypothetical protein
MKKIKFTATNIFLFLLISAMSFQFSSCKKQNEVIVKWDITIDGQTYSYEETLTEDDEFENGVAILQTNSGINNGGSQLILTSTDGGMITVQFGHINMTEDGSYLFNGGMDGMLSIMHNMNAYADDLGVGASTTLNITTFPTATVSTSDRLQETIVVGNFSGTVGDFNDVLHDISGSFEAIRIQ